MNPAIDVSNIVPVQINIAPTAIPYTNFGTLLVLGSSERIDVSERIREYTTIAGVAADFPADTPEYQAAIPYFSQEPQPSRLYIGRWAQSATPGVLNGAKLTASQQIMSNFTAIESGSFRISIDGDERSVTGIDLSDALNLNGVAAIIEQAMRPVTVAQGEEGWAGVTVRWSAADRRFVIKSGTTGIASSVSYASAAVSGTNIASLLGFTAASGASPLVAGLAAETLISAVHTLADKSRQWYGLTIATETQPSDEDHLEVAAYILASSRRRRYGVTITSTACLDATQGADLASKLRALGNKRVFWQYSSTNPYAITSFFGRAATVNFAASNAAITLMFKQEPGIAPEALTESEYAALKAKGGNAFLKLSNDASIIMPGQDADGTFFDEVHNLDWFENEVQTDVFNVLYQSTTKIPQTDDGAHIIVNTIEATCARAVANGVAAPGIWNATGFGQLRKGDTLSKGFYVFCPPMAFQSQADRETRALPPMQIALKLAGAVHSAPIIVNVNR